MEETEHNQRVVLTRALTIFLDRNRVRGDLWKEFDAEEDVRNARSKLARVERSVAAIVDGDADEAAAHKEAAIDDALDLINYTCFLVRKLEGEPGTYVG